MPTVELEVGGQMRRVDVEEGFTPDDLDYIANQLEAQDQSTTTTTPTTTRKHPWVRDVVRPDLAALGGMFGGALGAGGGLPTGPGAAVSGVAGAGLGAGIGAQIYDAIIDPLLEPQAQAAKTFRGEAAQAVRDVARGAAGEMTGQVVGKTVLQPIANKVGAWRAAKEAGKRSLQATADRAGIPLAASDLTQSKAIRQVENYPSYFAIGGSRVTQFREGQAAAAGKAIGDVADQLSNAQADAVTAGLKSQGGTKAVVQGWRQQSSQLFNQVERLAGDAPVVPTTQLRAMARSILERTASTPMGASGPAGDIVEQLTSVPLRDVIANEQIPFSVARQIEAELGDRAFRGGAQVGTLRQGELKALYSAVRSDIDSFLTSPSGADVAPALAEAKQVYATGKQLFNDSAKRIVLGTRNKPLAPEKVIERAFRPGNLTDTLDYKLLVDDDTYGQATQAWLRKLNEKATKDGVFSPERFLTQLAPYEKSGQLDIILPPEAAAQLKDATDVMRAMVTSNRLAANPSGTGQTLMSGGQLSTLASVPYLAATGHPLAATGAALGTAVPGAVGRFVTSPGGRDLLTYGPDLGAILGPQSARFLGQLGAQEAR